MFVSVGIYAICLALVLWGGKLPCKNKFHDDFLSLESTKALRGLAAFCILLHHISQEQIFQDKGVLSIFVNAGPFLVGIFFFCSGYGLLYNVNHKPN